jgi:DNA-directed RNA polymerase subunit RPC12/RpoP
MIIYVCNWCGHQFSLGTISSVTVKNVYNRKVILHICRECGRTYMPKSIQSNLSWTAEDSVAKQESTDKEGD